MLRKSGRKDHLLTSLTETSEHSLFALCFRWIALANMRIDENDMRYSFQITRIQSNLFLIHRSQSFKPLSVAR